MKNFRIGDIVRIKSLESIPSNKRVKTADGNPSLVTARKATLCGKTVEIIDILQSEKYNQTMYRVKDTQSGSIIHTHFSADLFEDVDNEGKYESEIVDGGNLIIVNIYEIANGERIFVERGHGHKIHQGVRGYIQALSYAAKRAWHKVDGKE